MFNLHKANKAVADYLIRLKAGEITYPENVEELYKFAKVEGWSEERTLRYRKSQFPTQEELDNMKTV